MSKNKVVSLRPAEDPDVVLERAKGNYTNVLILGYNHDDELEVRSDTKTTHEALLWLITLFQHKLLNGDYKED